MHQCYQDAMSCVRNVRKPDLFIIMTCNPEWPEILDQLEPHQKPNDRPNLIEKVFFLNLKNFSSTLRRKKYLEKLLHLPT